MAVPSAQAVDAVKEENRSAFSRAMLPEWVAGGAGRSSIVEDWPGGRVVLMSSNIQD